MKTRERFVEPTYAIFRVVTGLLLACHGAQKLFGMFGGHQMLAGKMLVAGIIEFGAGILVAVGLFAGIAALLASGEMAVAYFTSHASGGFWPIVNHGELAVVYCFAFLFIAAHGAGRWSLGAIVHRR
jgi:putative oxidoreductase